MDETETELEMFKRINTEQNKMIQELQDKYDRSNHELFVAKTTISALHYALRLMHGNARQSQIDTKHFAKYDAVFLVE